MKRLISGLILIMFAGTWLLFAGDVSVDNLKVYKNTTLYGPVNLIDGQIAIPTNGLVLYADFGSNSTPVADLSGNNNTGTVYNGITWVTNGISGGAYSFDGTNDYITFGTASGSLNVTGNTITISAWIWLDTTNQNYGWITIKGGASVGSYGLAIYYGNKIAFALKTSDYAFSDNPSSLLPTTATGAWHHVAGVYNGSYLRYFWDGQSVSTNVTKTGNIYSGAYPLAVGKETCWNSQIFDGLIDEVLIYNRALSDSEVAGLYIRNVSSLQGGGVISAASVSTSNSISQASSTATNIFMGKTGIGTNTPSEMLDVNGNLVVRGTITGNGSAISNISWAATASDAATGSTLATNVSHGNTAYGWGNHATNGYLSVTNFYLMPLGDIPMGDYQQGP